MRMMQSNSSAATSLQAKDLLPDDLYYRLQGYFPRSRVEYIAHVLTPGELRVLGTLSDALIIARIKRMSDAKLKRADRFMPLDEEQQRFYQAVQAEWLKGEQYLLGTRLGRSPTQRELFVDFMNNHNGQRFRAYFLMKYPDRMRRCPKLLAC